MKTKTITIERNFHIMNDDRFVMEKVSRTVEIEDDELPEYVENEVREEIEKNFKQYYPHIRTYLNFSDAENRNFHEQENALKDIAASTSIDAYRSVINNGEISGNNIPLWNPIPSTEQIIKEIKEYKFGANALKMVYGDMVKDNPELQKAFDEKLKELE